MKFYFLIFVASFSLKALAQNDEDTSAWDQTCDTGRTVTYLSNLEKDVLRELNKARTDPARYAALYIAPMTADFKGKINTRTHVETQEGVAAVNESVRELKNATAMGLLLPNENLHGTAYDHTRAQSKTKETGHTSPNGKTFADRLKKLRYPTAAECISYGENTGVGVVTALLIDDGVENRGHRKTILSKQLTVAGVSAGTHLIFRYMCTIDFAGGTPRQK